MTTGKPMCDRWYERAGSYRPWHFHVEGCTCGANAHYLPGQHGAHCAIRLNWDRDNLPAAGDAER